MTEDECKKAIAARTSEDESIFIFTEKIMRIRRKGTNAAVTNVVYQAARAAANMAVRTSTGVIDEDNALQILRDAAKLLGKL